MCVPEGKLAKRLLWVMVVLGALVAWWAGRPWMNPDSYQYLGLAEALSRGEYTYAGVQDTFRTPGYPVLLFVLIHLLRLPLAAITLLQVGMYLAALALAVRILLPNDRARLLCLGLAAMYPFTPGYCAVVLSEAPTLLLVTGAACLMARGYLPSAAVILAVAGMIRPELIPLPIGLLLFWVAQDRTRWPKAGLALAGCALVYLPYSIRNAIVFGRFQPVPVGSSFGTSLYEATWQSRLDWRDLHATYQGQYSPEARAAGLPEEFVRINREIGIDSSVAPFIPVNFPTAETQRRSGAVTLREALRWIRQNPGRYALHLLKNTGRLWITEAKPARLPTAAWWLLLAVSWAVLPLAAYGIWRDRARWLAATPLLYVWIIHLPLHTEARYTGVVRVLLVVYAALAIGALWDQRSGRSEPNLAAADQAAP